MTADDPPPLAERLRAIQARIEREHPGLTAPIAAFLERLRKVQAGEAAPRVGELLPDVVLPDLGGRLVRLHDLLAEGPTVLAFLRGQWCPYCRTYGAALADLELPGAARLVLVTPERAPFARGLTGDHGADARVLIDIDCGYALALGLAVWMDDVFAAQMIIADADVAASQGVRLWTVPIPATFVVDRRGVVRARHVDLNYRDRMALEEITSALRSIDAPAPAGLREG